MAGDANFSNVSLLLPFDGSNGSTTFTDKSGSPKTVTASGNAQISTAQSKFGGTSGAFDGSGDFLTSAYNTAFDLGSGDFTVEAWIYPTTLSGVKIVATTRNATGSDGGFVLFTNGSALAAQCWGPTAGTVLGSASSASGTLTVNAWNHVAYCRNGSTFRVFVNGTVGATTGSSSSAVVSTGRPFLIGTDPSTAGRDFAGYIDELRITKGVARYTANFTPPTAAFPTSGDTGASGSLSATEATGDTPTLSGTVVVSGALSASSAGADSAVITGVVSIQGLLAAAGGGQDTLAAAGAGRCQGSLTATESGTDVLAATGALVTFRQGTLDAVESGADILSATATEPRSAGGLAAAETDADTLSATGGPTSLTASMAAMDSGSDAASISVRALIAGAMAAAESGADSMTGLGGLPNSEGTLSAVEAGADSLGASGAALVSALLAAIELGADTAAVAVTASIAGAIAALESGYDSLIAEGDSPSSEGSFATTETGEDGLSAAGAALVSALLAAIDAGHDTANIAGQIATGGFLAAIETEQDTCAAFESAPSLDPSRLFVVPVEDRTLRVVAEKRLLSVAPEAREIGVAIENRTVLVEA